MRIIIHHLQSWLHFHHFWVRMSYSRREWRHQLRCHSQINVTEFGSVSISVKMVHSVGCGTKSTSPYLHWKQFTVRVMHDYTLCCQYDAHIKMSDEARLISETRTLVYIKYEVGASDFTPASILVVGNQKSTFSLYSARETFNKSFSLTWNTKIWNVFKVLYSISTLKGVWLFSTFFMKRFIVTNKSFSLTRKC